MKIIKTEDAIGHVLCHDMTKIVPGEIKDAVFRRGHVVKEEDIKELLSMGKEHLYVWENDDTKYHENEAAEIIVALCRGENIERGDVKEGKIDLYAKVDGIFEIDEEKTKNVNAIGEIVIAARGNNFPVKKGEKLAGTRVVPLLIDKGKMGIAKIIGGNTPLMKISPFKHKKVAIIVTGNEVYHGRIEDKFGPALASKLKEYDTDIISITILSDNPNDITNEINNKIKEGAEVILCTGGMSVDPDDTTPSAIKATGASVISYGAPVLPGSMFMIAYTEEGIPIMGLPGCVMYSRRTIFDLVLPKVMANKIITPDYLASLGVGGLCLDCETCIYPNCGFGR